MESTFKVQGDMDQITSFHFNLTYMKTIFSLIVSFCIYLDTTSRLTSVEGDVTEQENRLTVIESNVDLWDDRILVLEVANTDTQERLTTVEDIILSMYHT